jgi:hypothetical protein
MKTYTGVDVEIHVFFTSTLFRSEWSASRPGRFTPGERASIIHFIRSWVGPKAGVGDVEKRQFFTIPGLELWSLNRPARTQSLYRLSRVIIMMDKLVEWLAGETELLGENLPECRFVHLKPHMLPGREPGPLRWEDRNCRFSYVKAPLLVLLVVLWPLLPFAVILWTYAVWMRKHCVYGRVYSSDTNLSEVGNLK